MLAGSSLKYSRQVPDQEFVVAGPDLNLPTRGLSAIVGVSLNRGNSRNACSWRPFLDRVPHSPSHAPARTTRDGQVGFHSSRRHPESSATEPLFADERLVARFRPLPTVRGRIDEMLWGATRYQSQREEPDSKRTSDDCIRNHDQQTGSLGNATHPAVRWRLDSGVAIAVRRLMRRVPGAPCWRRLWHSSTCG